MTPLIIFRVPVERILDLRHRELRQGLPPESARFDGDDSPGAVHLAAEINGKIVGCATVLLNTFDNQPACQLRGMAVDRQHQRSGVGRKLLEEVHRIATEKKVNILWANARTPAVDFYRKHGWQTVGEEFQIPHAGPHFRMIRKVGGQFSHV
jgi:predicted GNAT family N-acyltransferase